MKLPVYELKISENLNDDSEVSYVALVDAPAIQKDFLAFKEEFINPSKGEHETDFIPRCVKYVIDEGKSSEQAVAICNSIWEQHFAEGYTDYPKEATDNAKIALRWAEQNGWGDCGTQVGKIRANQLANREPISRDTIARMSAFERHRQNSDNQLGDGCGRLMWLAWGGDAGIEWAKRKLEQIDKFAEVCPPATQDIATNLKNRQNAIDVAHYGPLNPNLPSEEYWIIKGKQFNTTPEEAKKSRCANCSFFNVSQAIKYCIAKGIGNELDPYNVINAGDLGYCEAFDFKCASQRTCDAWVVGGPIKMEATKVSIDYDETLSTEKGKALAKRLISNGDAVYIISARNDKSGMLAIAKELGIPESRVFATGSNKAKIEKIKELGIAKHHDNNPDVIKELGSIGVKFYQAFQIVSEDEHIISGPLMVADMPIYRNNDKFGEHYVTFSAETIRQIAIKFAKKKYQNHVNLMHDPNMVIDGCTMFESFIVDKKRGIMPMQGFEDIADGSWFGSFYVENPEVWKNIKDGFLKGFSVEGMFDYDEPTKTLSAEEEALKKISELLNVII